MYSIQFTGMRPLVADRDGVVPNHIANTVN